MIDTEYLPIPGDFLFHRYFVADDEFVAGKVLEWDSAKQEVTGNPEANKFLKRAAYREGWDYSADKI